MENKIAEIREDFRKKLDVIFESIGALGRETTDKILANGGTHEDILTITQDYIDRGMLWTDEFLDAFKVTMSELTGIEEA